MIIEVKWAEPKGQPAELLLDLDEIAYCNKVTDESKDIHLVCPDGIGSLKTIKTFYLHVQLKSGTDLMLADGEKLYNIIKDYNRIKVE